MLKIVLALFPIIFFMSRELVFYFYSAVGIALLFKKEKLAVVPFVIAALCFFDAGIWYPVIINFSLFLLAFGSLVFPPNFVEQIARKQEPDLSLEGQSYCFKVAVVWAVFFFLNTIFSLYTVLLNNMAFWVLYNGFISYLLIGILFGIEYLLRIKVRG